MDKDLNSLNIQISADATPAVTALQDVGKASTATKTRVANLSKTISGLNTALKNFQKVADSIDAGGLGFLNFDAARKELNGMVGDLNKFRILSRDLGRNLKDSMTAAYKVAQKFQRATARPIKFVDASEGVTSLLGRIDGVYAHIKEVNKETFNLLGKQAERNRETLNVDRRRLEVEVEIDRLRRKRLGAAERELAIARQISKEVQSRKVVMPTVTEYKAMPYEMPVVHEPARKSVSTDDDSPVPMFTKASRAAFLERRMAELQAKNKLAVGATPEVREVGRQTARQVATIRSNTRSIEKNTREVARLSSAYLLYHAMRGTAARFSEDMQDYQKNRSRVKAWGLNSDEQQDLFAMAERLRVQNKYLSKGGSINALMAAASSIGHWNPGVIGQTINDAVSRAQAQQLLGYNNSNVEDIVKNLYGVAEARQVVNDPKRVKDTFKLVNDIVSTTAGKVSVGDIETIFRNMGGSAVTLSDEGLRRIAAFAEQVKVAGHGVQGGSGAGVSQVGTMIKMLTLMGIGKPTSKMAKAQMAELGILESRVYRQGFMPRTGEEALGMTLFSPDDAKRREWQRDSKFDNVIHDTVAIETKHELAKAGVYNKDLMQRDPILWVQKVVPLVMRYTASKEHRQDYYGPLAKGHEKETAVEFLKSMTEAARFQAANTFWAKSGLSNRVQVPLAVFSSTQFQARSEAMLHTSMKQTDPTANMYSRGELRPALLRFNASVTSFIQTMEPLALWIGKITNYLSDLIDKMTDWAEEFKDLAKYTGAWVIVRALMAGMRHVVEMYHLLDGAMVRHQTVLREQIMANEMGGASSAARLSATRPVEEEGVAQQKAPAREIKEAAVVSPAQSIGKDVARSAEESIGFFTRMTEGVGSRIQRMKNAFMGFFNFVATWGMRVFRGLGMALLAVDVATIVYQWVKDFEIAGQRIGDVVDGIADKLKSTFTEKKLDFQAINDPGVAAKVNEMERKRSDLIKKVNTLKENKRTEDEGSTVSAFDSIEKIKGFFKGSVQTDNEIAKLNKAIDELTKSIYELKHQQSNIFGGAESIIQNLRAAYQNNNLAKQLKDVKSLDRDIKNAESAYQVGIKGGAPEKDLLNQKSHIDHLKELQKQNVQRLTTDARAMDIFIGQLNQFKDEHKDNVAVVDAIFNTTEDIAETMGQIREYITGIPYQKPESKEARSEMKVIRPLDKDAHQAGSTVDKEVALAGEVEPTQIGVQKEVFKVSTHLAQLRKQYNEAKFMNKAGEGDEESMAATLRREQESLREDIVSGKFKNKDGAVPFIANGGLGRNPGQGLTTEDVDLNLKDAESGMTGNQVAYQRALVKRAKVFNTFFSALLKDLNETIDNGVNQLRDSAQALDKFNAEYLSNAAMQDFDDKSALARRKIIKKLPDEKDSAWTRRIREFDRKNAEIGFQKSMVFGNRQIKRDQDATEKYKVNLMTSGQQMDFDFAQSARLEDANAAQAQREIAARAKRLADTKRTEEERKQIYDEAAKEIERIETAHNDRMQAMQQDFEERRYGLSKKHLAQKVEDWQNLGKQLEGVQDTFMDGFIKADEAWLDGDKNAWRKWGIEVLKMLRDMWLKQGLSRLLGDITSKITDGIGALFGRGKDGEPSKGGGTINIAESLVDGVKGFFGIGGDSVSEPGKGAGGMFSSLFSSVSSFIQSPIQSLKNLFSPSQVVPTSVPFAPLQTTSLAESMGLPKNLATVGLPGAPAVPGLGTPFTSVSPMGGMNPMGGMSPMGGMNPMGMNPMGMNPMGGGSSLLGGGLGDTLGGGPGGGLDGALSGLTDVSSQLTDNFQSLVTTGDTFNTGLSMVNDTSGLVNTGLTTMQTGTQAATAAQQALTTVETAGQAAKQTSNTTEATTSVVLKTFTTALQQAVTAVIQFVATMKSSQVAHMMANGGIITPKGAVPLKMYASGGIARSAQVAVFGEGSKPEAFVPLPDGRAIPVKFDASGMKQESSGGNNFNISISVNNNADGSSNERTAQKGDENANMKQLAGRLRDIVKFEIANQSRPGGLLYNQ